MKSVTLLLIALLTNSVFAMSSEKKLVTGTLPDEYKNVHREGTIQEDKRMIAGTFESKKKEKKTYLDGLRNKLQGSPGFYGF